MKKLVLFGAGKIGRSFIGQLFALSGYEVVFVDVNKEVINELNRLHEYKVVIKGDKPDEVVMVRNVRGVLATDTENVVKELSDCDIAAISVGQKGLPQVIITLAKGLLLRKQAFGSRPLDIILAENLRNADIFVREFLKNLLNDKYPIDELVGLVETSIGKMVPIMTAEDQENDLLQVFAEPYNTLILDKKAFKNPIPEVKGLAPKENIKAWVDRKSYIHNFGHAAAAYSGYLAEPTVKYLFEVLNNSAVKNFTRQAMEQTACVLLKKYPEEFTLIDLKMHVEDLLHRFENKALGDTVFRIGCDLQRKLNRNDRVLSPLIDGLITNSRIDKILHTFSFGLCFKAKDDKSRMLPDDQVFSQSLSEKGLPFVLTRFCGLDPITDQHIIKKICSFGWDLSPLKINLEQVFSRHTFSM